jgi:hypothetical protein
MGLEEREGCMEAPKKIEKRIEGKRGGGEEAKRKKGGRRRGGKKKEKEAEVTQKWGKGEGRRRRVTVS